MPLVVEVSPGVELRIEARNLSPPPAAVVRAVLTSVYGGITFKQTGATNMGYILPADKQVKLGIAYVDADGNPAAVDGAVAWSSSDEAIAVVTSNNPDGTEVTLNAGKVGTAQISAVADADLGTGTTQLVTLFDVEVVAGAAVAGTISPVGEQEPQA